MDILKITQKINKRHRVFIEVIVVVLLVFFADRALIQSLKQKKYKLDSQVRIEEARLQRNIAVKSNLVSLSKDYDLTKDYFARISSNDTELKASMLQEIERISRLAKVSIISISSSETVEETEATKIYSAELRIEGKFANFLKFFNYFSLSDLLLDYDTFTLSSTNDEGTKLRFDSVVKYTVFK